MLDSANDKAKPFRWLKWARNMATAYSLDSASAHVLLLVATYADIDTGIAYPKRELLAELARRSIPTIDRTIRVLRARGMISRCNCETSKGSIARGFQLHENPIQPITHDSKSVADIREMSHGHKTSAPITHDRGAPSPVIAPTYHGRQHIEGTIGTHHLNGQFEDWLQRPPVEPTRAPPAAQKRERALPKTGEEMSGDTSPGRRAVQASFSAALKASR